MHHTVEVTYNKLYLYHCHMHNPGWDPKFKTALFPDSEDFNRKGKVC